MVAALMVLAVAWPALGQEEDRPRAGRKDPTQSAGAGREDRALFRDLSPEERAKLKEKWQSMSEDEKQQFRAGMREKLQSGRPDADPKAALKNLEGQIAKLKAEQEQYIGELREIREIAAKEKATQTVKRLESLIAKQQKDFTGRLQELEQKRQQLQRSLRVREARKPPAEPAVEPAGKKAPDFTLKSFDGKSVSLSDYRGKIVVLEWFNFECPFVQYHYNKATTMIDLANKYKDKNVVWLSMNSTSHITPEANIEFAKKHKLPYPILDDRPGQVGHAYGAETTPHMFIIDRGGNIMYEGAIDNSPLGKTPAGEQLISYVDQALAEVLAGKAISAPKTKPYGCTVKYPR
jgi:peroxiredoxin